MLSLPVAVERDGVVYVVGVRDGFYRIRRSSDGGATWLPYSDGEVEKPVAEACTDQRAALVKLTGQGAPLLACVAGWPELVVYASYDDGETWEAESTIGGA
jgi:hypothetical protein